MIEIVPSILSKTLEDAQRKLNLCEETVQTVHLDILDGSFVKNNTFPLYELSHIHTPCKIRAHLMVRDPLRIAQKLQGHVDTVFFHYEAVTDVGRVIEILSKYFHVGVALNIETPARVLFSYLSQIDYVLIMTVATGHSGGVFDSTPLKKVLQLKTLKKDLIVGVDGGVSVKTASEILQYPVDFVTPGSALFSSKDFASSLFDLKKAFYCP